MWEVLGVSVWRDGTRRNRRRSSIVDCMILYLLLFDGRL